MSMAENGVSSARVVAPDAPPRRFDGWLVGVLCIALAIHVVYFALGHPSFHYDDSWYAECTNRLIDRWAHGGVTEAYDYFTRVALGGIKSPFILLPAIPMVLLLGRVELAYILTSVCGWLIASSYLFHLIARYTERWIAAAAVLLFSLMPLTVDMTRQFFVETWLTALTVAFVFHYLRSDGFSRRGDALLAGAAGGLALLAKVTFPVYVAGIVLLDLALRLPGSRSWWRDVIFGLLIGASGPVLGFAVAQKLSPDWSLLGGLVLSAVLFILNLRGPELRRAVAAASALGLWLVLPWYAYNAQKIFPFAFSAASGDLSVNYGDREYLTLASIARYWVSNLNVGMGLSFAASLGVACLLALLTAIVRRGDEEYRRRWRRGLLIALAWLLVGALVCTGVRNRTTRYILPLMPALALLLALFWQHIALRARGLAGALIAAGLATSLTACILFSFTTRSMGWREYRFADPGLTTAGLPRPEKVPLRDVIHVTMRAVGPQPWLREPIVFLVSETSTVNQNSLTFKATCERSPVAFGMVPYNTTFEAAVKELARADVLIAIEGGEDRLYSEFVNKNGRQVLADIRSGKLGGWHFREDLAVPFPDGSVARYFERVPTTTQNSP